MISLDQFAEDGEWYEGENDVESCKCRIYGQVVDGLHLAVEKVAGNPGTLPDEGRLSQEHTAR